MACFEYCFDRILQAAFSDVGHIDEIKPREYCAATGLPVGVTLIRRFTSSVLTGDKPPKLITPGAYAQFVKALSSAAEALPVNTQSLNTDVQAMALDTGGALLSVGVGHALHANAEGQHYETDLRTVFVAGTSR
jgi:hypothetical protein